MENLGILSWRKWSFIRRAQVLGGATGAVLSIVLHFLMKAFGIGESLIGFFLYVLWRLAILPALFIASVFGKRWHIEGPYEVPSTLLFLIVLTNSALSVVIASVIAWLYQPLMQRQKRTDMRND